LPKLQEDSILWALTIFALITHCLQTKVQDETKRALEHIDSRSIKLALRSVC